MISMSGNLEIGDSREYQRGRKEFGTDPIDRLSLFRGYFKLRIPYSNFHENLRVGKIYATPIAVYFGDFRDGDTE